VDWSAVGLAGILQLRWSFSGPNPPYMVRRGDTKRARRGDGHGKGCARPNYNVVCAESATRCRGGWVSSNKPNESEARIENRLDIILGGLAPLVI
jgi:hypothetical protein